MRLLRKIGYPFSLLYAGIVYLRNFLYDIGIFSSTTYDVPVVCIGNLTLGGTGKTPMTELIIALLKDSNKVAVLSRGYKRKSKGFVLARPTTKVAEIGDEPFQIYSRFPEIVLAVDADRRNGIDQLIRSHKPDIIVLDDAFQHRAVQPALSILLTSYDALYTTDWYIPTGKLRDNRKEARRADIIVVTKCPVDLSEASMNRIEKELQPKSYQLVLFSYLHYNRQLFGGEIPLTLNDLKNKKITLVTGIANPQPLISYLHKEKVLIEHLKFADHHDFTDLEIKKLNEKKFILTTEKDFMRLRGKVTVLYYIRVEHRFIGDGKKVLEEQLKNLLGSAS